MKRNLASADYFLWLRRNKITASRCKNCGAVHYPARGNLRDLYCLKKWKRQISGKGELAAFSVVYVPPSAMMEAGYGRENPNVVGIVNYAKDLWSALKSSD